jgi:hypothetical protein
MAAGLALVLLLVGGSAPAADPALLVTVGEMTDRAAVLWVRGDSPGTVTVRYGGAPGSLDHRHERPLGEP